MKNVLLAVFLMVTSSALHAETAEEKGLSISQEVIAVVKKVAAG